MTPLDQLREAVLEAASGLHPNGIQPTLERPRRADFGHYSTNAALLLAPLVGAPPRDVAGRLGEALSARLGDRVERVEVAGPGFLNLFLSDGWFVEATRTVLDAGSAWGGGGAATPERINVEFVSANPTGPLTAAGGRHAAMGDALSRLLEFEGHEVHREYYVNDAGSQVLRLGESIQARARGEEPPENGYQGAYVADLAAQIDGAADGDPAELARQGVELLLGSIRRTLHDFRVDFDTWFSERTLHDEGKIEHAYETLAKLGRTYESEGALWLRTTDLGDDKDRVLRRSSGEDTYFGADIAYHLDKQERGWSRLIDVWGADHHGYVPRMKVMFEALGNDPGQLELIIMQFVNVIEHGQSASMSKRRGDFVTLDDLVADIGVDAARYFMLSRSHDSTVDLDLELARRESAENPVYYVQYAHARMASILREASGFGAPGEPLHPSERDLVLKLLAFPGEVSEAAERRAPHRIATYALELAQTFTAFYRDCKVLGSPSQDFRLRLSVVTQRTMARALGLLGVAAPESM